VADRGTLCDCLLLRCPNSVIDAFLYPTIYPPIDTQV
jgi:hypothetical protein